VHQPVRGTLGNAFGRLLFDAPISALDPGSRTEVNKVIRELAQAGLTMVVVPHDLQFAGRISDDIVFMDEGGIVESGPPDQILCSRAESCTAQFVSSNGA
jgi:ABC-type polar amino acid transport system ATPase subunit